MTVPPLNHLHLCWAASSSMRCSCCRLAMQAGEGMEQEELSCKAQSSPSCRVITSSGVKDPQQLQHLLQGLLLPPLHVLLMTQQQQQAVLLQQQLVLTWRSASAACRNAVGA